MPTVTYEPVSKIGGTSASLQSANPPPFTTISSIFWDDDTQILWDDDTPVTWD